MNKYVLILLVTMITMISVEIVESVQTNNYELRAVPTSGKVVIDGKLDDWDLTGGILMCYDTDTLLETNSVKAYLMYDTQYLYVGFHFKDRTPMFNRVNPKIEPGCGWRSDCVQLRFWTDEQKPIGPGGSWLTHIDCYYFTDEKRATSQIFHMDMSKGDAGLESLVEEAIGRGVDAVFRKDDDNKGYVQEIRIEWGQIRRTGRPFLAGETFRMGIECFWGDASGSKWYQQRVTDLLNIDNPKREFFWTSHNCWGKVVLLAKGNLPEEKQALSLLLTGPEKMSVDKYKTKGFLKIEYDISSDGYVTLVIDKPDGTRIKNLISDFPRKAGKNIDYWDGTDDSGKLVEIGKYRVRGLWHPELDAIYQFAYGTPGIPPWETPDGTGGWMSDHNVSAIASDGNCIYIAGVYYDCGTGTIALDSNGKKIWGVRPVSMIRNPVLAADDKYLYLACGAEAYFGYKVGLKEPEYDTLLLSRLDKKTGTAVPFTGDKRAFVELTKVKGLKGLTYEYGELVENKLFSADVFLPRVKGLSVENRTVYVSSYWEDEVLLVDAETGKLKDRIKIKSPAGLSVDGKGNLFIVSVLDKQVLKLNLNTKLISTVISDGLSAPVGLALDKTGNIYVSDMGSDMCVKVFSQYGKLLRTIGKKGGRNWVGTYDSGGMLLPYSITVDGKQRLWVTEFDGCPRRISVWDATRGVFEKEYVSAHCYAGSYCWINPNEPEHAIAQNALFELDWEKGTYHTLSTIWRPTRKNEYFGPYPNARYQQEIYFKARKFLVTECYNTMVISEKRKDRYQPLSAIGNVGHYIYETSNVHTSPYDGLRLLSVPKLFRNRLYWLPKLNEIMNTEYTEFFSGIFSNPAYVISMNLLDIFSKAQAGNKYCFPTTNFIWTDKNGDGLVQEDELTFFESPGVDPVRMYWGWTCGVSSNLTLYPSATAEGGLFIWEMPVTGWTDCGAPVYNDKSAKLIISENKEYVTQSISQWVDNKGNILSNQNPVMTMYSVDGKRLWIYPNKYAGVHASHLAPRSDRGMLIGTINVIGSVFVDGIGEIFALNGNFGQAFFMTTDGLLVSSLFQDSRSAPDDMPKVAVRNQSHRNTTMGAEWFGGQFFRNPRDSKIYLVGEHHTGSGNCIYEVTGLDKMKLLPTKEVVFDSTTYTLAEKSTTVVTAERKVSVRLESVAQKLRAPAVIDGLCDEYSTSEKYYVRFAFDDTHSANVLIAYDDQNLYLFYQVRDDSPLRNLAKFGLYELFKSGDCVLFDFGTKRDVNDSSNKPIEGDIRLLLAKQKGEYTVLVYRYVSVGSKDWVEITSGLGTYRIDKVEQLTDMKVATKETDTGYTFESAIPLSTIGFRPNLAKNYRGDFGVIYSDNEGTKNTLRLHWASKNTGIVSDSFTEVQIQPSFWGIIHFEQ